MVNMARSTRVLTRKALIGLVELLGVMGLVLFGPAGTLHWLEGWVFLFIFLAASLGITLDLMKRDPRLLERRLQAGALAEKKIKQKIIQSLASLAFVSTLVVPALDHRFGWSHVALPVNVLGDGLVCLGFLIVFFVFRENTFASATVDVEAEQKVIDTGPYAWVRHPMYAGALVLLVGIPLGLGSYVGLLTVVPMLAVIVFRLLDEETLLVKELPGYDAYRRRTKYRLVPGVW
jgi:protein-S-isoprenylcysteine O-methyltransferase Ste14